MCIYVYKREREKGRERGRESRRQRERERERSIRTDIQTQPSNNGVVGADSRCRVDRRKALDLQNSDCRPTVGVALTRTLAHWFF